MTAGIATTLGLPAHWTESIYVVVVVLGVALIVSIFFVWAIGVPIGVTLGITFSMRAFSEAVGVGFGVGFGIAFGLTGPVGFGVGWGDIGAVALLITCLSAISASLGAAGGVTNVWARGMADISAAVGLSVALLAMFFRLPILALEAVLQTWAKYGRVFKAQGGLHRVPVLYHNLSYLPHPLLQRHILAEADADTVLTRRVLDACSIAPGQRRTGRKVEARLRARDLTRFAKERNFQAIAELRGVWLPGVEGADPLLLSFSEAARYLGAAQAAFNPYHQLKHLLGFENQSRAIENTVRVQRDVFTQPFEEPIEALRKVGREMRAEAEKAAEGLIVNPFRAGNPLSGEEGPELFRGREQAVRDIEEILADSKRAASFLLLAPRRAGKTSLLKMLPRMVPDAVCVFFDLQAHPVASVGAFWTKLAEQAAIQAKRDRRVELPGLPTGPPTEAAAEWLHELDRLPGGRRVLIAIDEFERLEDLFPGSRQEFLQLMGLFRATIQHRTGVRLLVSGAAPFEELDRVWDDHFISARQIRLPFLDLPTSVGLLTQPSPEFPSGTIPEDVAREVYQRTGGQPYLLQVFGSVLVSRLNDEKRTVATAADVHAVENRAIEWAESYFRDMYKSAPEAAREALHRLSQGERVDLAPATRRWLAPRHLLTPDDRLSVALFGAWIEHYALV